MAEHESKSQRSAQIFGLEYEEESGRALIWHDSRSLFQSPTILEAVGHQSMNMNPPITPPRTMRRPYVRPNPRARAWTRAEASLLLDDDDPVEDPPKPVNVLVAEEPALLAVPPPEVVVAVIVEIVEVFTRTGF